MFDATQYVKSDSNNSQSDRSLIPEGQYVARMTNFERKKTSKGGEMLNVEFTVDVGSAARKCWHNFNMVHSKEDVVNIAMETLGRFCIAGGYNSIQDPWNPVELMGKELEIYIVIEGQYNNIKAFYPRKMNAVDQGKALYGEKQKPSSDDDEIPWSGGG